MELIQQTLELQAYAIVFAMTAGALWIVVRWLMRMLR